MDPAELEAAHDDSVTLEARSQAANLYLTWAQRVRLELTACNLIIWTTLIYSVGV